MPSSNQSLLEDFLDSISSKDRSGSGGRRPPEAGAYMCFKTSSVKRFGDVKCQMYIVVSHLLMFAESSPVIF